MLWITESPWAASAASSIAIPARMSGLSTTCPRSGDGPAITARWGSHSTMRAPMPISSSTKNRRDSNSFSNTNSRPSHCEATTIAIDIKSAGKAGHGPSSSFGTWPPRSGRMRRSWSASTTSFAPSRRGRTPSRSNAMRVARKSSGRTPSIVTAPFVTAASPRNDPISMWSGPIANGVGGGGQADAPETRQHRPREQDRRADPGAQPWVQLARLGARRVHLDRIRRRPRDRRAEVCQQLQHRLDVANVGNVLDTAGPLGEQGGREDGERRVLVARRADRPFERAPARYAERRRHRSRKLWDALRTRQARANVRRVHPVLALALLATAGLLATRLPRLALPPHPSLHLDVAIVAGAPLVLVGLLLGPGIELVSRPLFRALAPVIALAIGCIGAVLGARCEWRVLRRIPRGAWALAAVSARAVFLVVALSAWLLARWIPLLGVAWAPRLPTVLGPAAVAAVSAPRTV